MDRIAFLLTGFLGLALIAVYAFRCWRRAETMNLSVAVNLVLHSGGIVAAGFLILGTMVPGFRTMLSSVDLYLLIGGITAGLVSGQGLKREFGLGGKPPTPTTGEPAVQALAAVPAPATASDRPG